MDILDLTFVVIRFWGIKTCHLKNKTNITQCNQDTTQRRRLIQREVLEATFRDL